MSPNVLHWHWTRANRGHACHDFRVEAARIDSAKVAEVGRDVERDAVKCHPPAARDPDRGEFASASPNACLSILATGIDIKTLQRLDDAILKTAQELVKVALTVAKFDDWVGDQLTGAVIGDVATSFDFEDLNVARRDHVCRGIAASPECDDVGMLDEKERVGALVFLAGCDTVEMPGVRLLVVEYAPVEKLGGF